MHLRGRRIEGGTYFFPLVLFLVVTVQLLLMLMLVVVPIVMMAVAPFHWIPPLFFISLHIDAAGPSKEGRTPRRTQFAVVVSFVIKTVLILILILVFFILILRIRGLGNRYISKGKDVGCTYVCMCVCVYMWTSISI